ncbi:Zinc finger CCCH domain-containing protein 19 [Apostasia shenzhenica]|uniref:Zinc finger CCCH domain-containing protein 19 n=1 Tax=Apostasia shenzhenica TaxID=1088818 RepID=A0A2H9ZTM1_9ASPA|nr:Zinc finger CCCH domain-containing protein 19 [Apostasia shenzhenica]
MPSYTCATSINGPRPARPDLPGPGGESHVRPFHRATRVIWWFRRNPSRCSMEGGEDQLIFCGDGDDFRHQIEQQQHEVSAFQEGQLPLQLPAMDASSHCEDSNEEGMLEGSPETNDPGLSFPTSGRGGGVASASVPGPSRSGGEIMQEVSENMVVATVGDAAEIDVEDTDRTAMVLGDSDVASMTVDDAASVPAKRKRGRPPKNPGERTAPVKKKERDDVCFVCFDRTNPNLVFCNRRACYKAYHPACVNREEAFFRGKGKWNCDQDGTWKFIALCFYSISHTYYPFLSICQKTAYHMCYMCTTSYCKVCINQENKYVSLRGTHGFCQSCHNTVKLIEENKLACVEKDGVSFDDTDSFTVLFKAYWLDLKGKLSMTSIELSNARHPCAVTQNEESSDELYDANKDQDISSESSSGHEGNISLKKKLRRPSQAFTAGESLACEIDGGVSMFKETEWASKELLELVAHMRSGDQSFISQFEVQAILLEYIKKYNLRDPRRKSQIVCDMRLRNLFGKERVGHFEMLKLLELHFVKKEASQVVASDNQVESVKSDYKHIDAFEEGETIARLGSEKQRKSHKRTEREQLSNLDDYAAVDVHNITQIFLRRSLVEELLDDIETFNDKVVGSFVRIRIPNSGQRQDLYRLVQVVGIQESTKPYKVGKKTTDLVLEILNLDKKETSTIDSISNQDFTEVSYLICLIVAL